MRNFTSSAAGVFTFILIVTIFGFKFNIVNLGGSGLRLDDILIILAIPLLMLGVSRFYIRKEFSVFIFFFVFSFISLLIGFLHGRISLLEGGLYWARNIQYMYFFFFGLILSNRIDMDKIFRVYIFYVLAILVLQYFSLLPTFSLFVGSGRAVANTGGPYELAVIAALMCLFFWFQSPRKIYLFLAVVILLLTQSRITLVGLLLIFFVRSFNLKGRVLFLIGGFLVFLLLATLDARVLDRFALLFDSKMTDSFNTLLNGIGGFKNTWDYREWAFLTYNDVLTDAEGDKSTLIRFIRQYALLSSVSDCGLECYLVGLGPSFAGAAVDGNLVRLFVEYGIIGTVLFIVGIWRVVAATRNVTLSSYFLLMVFTALAIDILVSSKAMSLLWFLCGYYSINRNVLAEVSAVNLSKQPEGLS